MTTDQGQLQHLKPSAIISMSVAERKRVLRAAAEAAEEVYRTHPELTAFEAFGEDDLLDRPD